MFEAVNGNTVYVEDFQLCVESMMTTPSPISDNVVIICGIYDDNTITYIWLCCYYMWNLWWQHHRLYLIMLLLCVESMMTTPSSLSDNVFIVCGIYDDNTITISDNVVIMCGIYDDNTISSIWRCDDNVVIPGKNSPCSFMSST